MHASRRSSPAPPSSPSRHRSEHRRGALFGRPLPRASMSPHANLLQLGYSREALYFGSSYKGFPCGSCSAGRESLMSCIPKPYLIIITSLTTKPVRLRTKPSAWQAVLRFLFVLPSWGGPLKKVRQRGIDCGRSHWRSVTSCGLGDGTPPLARQRCLCRSREGPGCRPSSRRPAT